jgi:outer membrane protein OmpA-like peptidoglycan-associated protein
LAASLLAGGPAAAQVNFDQRALDQLNKPSAPVPSGGAVPAPPAAASPAQTTPAPTTPPKAATKSPPARNQRPPAHPPAHPATSTETKPAAPAKGAPNAPAHPPNARNAPLPAAPPVNPNIPPPIVVPARPSPPPQPVPVVPTAPGAALEIPGGERITFGAGVSDLNPATEGAIRALVHTAPPFNTTTFTVTAYAAGSEEDPSTPRRLSLSRALAVRSVLITEGVASVRIYVKALGAAAPNAADGPPDRVDIVVATPQTGGSPASATPPPPAAPTSPPRPR